MRKLFLVLLALMVCPLSSEAVNFRRLRTAVLEKLAVPTTAGNYPDSLILNEIGRATVDIASFSLALRIQVKLAANAGAVRGASWSVAIPGDTNLLVTTLWKRKTTTDTLSNLVGFAEVTTDKFGQQQSSQPIFCNFRIGDSLKVMIQPTPIQNDTLWAEVAVYPKWCLGVSGTQTPDTSTENPLPYPYENWVATLTALRLLSREDPFRTNVITALYQEFTTSIGLYRKDLVERISDLYVLPNYIKATEEGKAK